MKCYFALSDDVCKRDDYYAMFECTLNSATKNTTLELHCLYDFRKAECENIEDDKIYQLLKKYNVNIHLISIDFEKELFNVYSDEYLKQIGVTKTSMYSRFLRFMLSDVEKTDEYVLYADADLIFLRDIKLENFKTLPDTIGVCPEFFNNYTYTNFNAGVMLININSYKNAKIKLIEMLQKGIKAEIECCDQGYLNTIYKNNFLRINNLYNWKAYWGEQDKAYIIHLRGLKPVITKKNTDAKFIDFLSLFMHKNKKQTVKGMRKYFSMFADYYNVDKELVMKNLEETLNCQKPEYYNLFHRVIRKIKTN